MRDLARALDSRHPAMVAGKAKKKKVSKGKGTVAAVPFRISVLHFLAFLLISL
jgi:hypothetical protein